MQLIIILVILLIAIVFYLYSQGIVYFPQKTHGGRFPLDEHRHRYTPKIQYAEYSPTSDMGSNEFVSFDTLDIKRRCVLTQ